MRATQKVCIFCLLFVVLMYLWAIDNKIDGIENLLHDIIKNQFTTYDEMYMMRSNMMVRNRLDGYAWIVKSTNDVWDVVNVDIRMKGNKK